MSLQLNDVRIAGNLTRDPQVRFLANDMTVAQFGIATNRRWKAADGQMRDEATFIDCEVWGKTAEMVGQHFGKGMAIYVSGRLKLESWEKDGQKHSKLKLVVDEVKFVESKGAAAPVTATPAASPAGEPAGAAGSAKPAGRPAPGQDEPPF